MKLTAELANPIILRIQTVVDYNINMMNEAGIIVASTDPSRIDKVHQGAVYVINTKKSLVIHPDEVDKFQGSKEGVNLPIEFLGEIIGVVGLTGDPKELHKFAQVLKVTVETMIEQVYLNNKLNYQKTMMQSWLMDLINPHYFDEKKAETYANHYLGMDVTKKVQIILLSFSWKDDTKKPNQNLTIKDEMLTRIRLLFPSVHFLGFIDNHHCIIGLPSSKDFERELTRMKDEFSFYQVKIGIGNDYSNVSGYRKSYFEAKESIDLWNLFGNNKEYSHINEWGLTRLIFQVPSEYRNQLLHAYFNEEMKLSKELTKTMETLFECQLNMKEAAEKLHIHRNTLLYRLESIEGILGLNPRKFDDAVVLRILLIIQQMNKR